MNYDIANIIRTYIEPLPFADRVASTVRAVSVYMDNGGKTIKKTYPVDCGVTEKDCLAGKYQDLTPDSSRKSIIYFEDNGTARVENNTPDFSFISSLRLVCWMNLNKMGKIGCSNSALAVASLLNAIPTRYFNSGIYTRIQIQVNNEVAKNASIFSKYTYDEAVTQYLMYPFDYFALDMTVKFTIPKHCITEWENQTEVCEDK